MLRKPIWRVSIAALVSFAALGAASAEAMTWNYQNIWGATSSTDCLNSFGKRAGYISAIYYDGSPGYNCWTNSTQSAYDTDLSTDSFVTEPGTGITPSVVTAQKWHNSHINGWSYTVYSLAKCGGTPTSVPYPGTTSTGTADRSISTATFTATCRA